MILNVHPVHGPAGVGDEEMVVTFIQRTDESRCNAYLRATEQGRTRVMKRDDWADMLSHPSFRGAWDDIVYSTIPLSA